MKTRIILLFSLLVLLYSCKPVVDEFTPSNGEVDFSSFVAVGNSLSAGYANGALYTSGQEYSFTKILAGQLESVGNNGSFNIPFMPTEDGVGITLSSQGLMLDTKFIVGYNTDCLGTTSLGPVRLEENPDQQKLLQQLTTSVADLGPFNNVSVPGIKITHLFAAGFGLLNPYYGRFATNPATDRILDEPAKVNPTFFHFWVGSNDILDYATSGGTQSFTPVEGAVGVGFEATYHAAIQSMVALTDKGVIVNIPDVIAIPYFKTIPYNPIVLTDQNLVDALNTAYAQYNVLMEANGLPYRINFSLGQNPMVIYDKNMPLPPQFDQFKFRQMMPDELALLTLPQDSLKCAQWGSVKPVPDQFILTAHELGVVKSVTNAYNNVIKNAADEYDLALFDAKKLIQEVDQKGYTIDGITFTSALITGNSYSNDGIHLTPQGNAVVANALIQTINNKYGSSIPQVNVTDYPPMLLP